MQFNCNVDELLKKIRQGDNSALNSLYDSTNKQLFAFCYTYLHNKNDCEDILSRVYLTIIQQISLYNGKTGISWIYTIAKNLCINYLNSLKRVNFLDFSDEENINAYLKDKNYEISLKDESGIIQKSEKLLDENEFRVVILKAVCGYKFKEISKIINKGEATARWQYNNALKKLRKALKEEINEQ